MGKVYLTNAFSINMLKKFPTIVMFDKLDRLEFCTDIDVALDDVTLVNAIGDENTINVINTLCGTNLEKKKNIVQIQLGKYDRALVIMVLERLREHKALSFDEVKDMYDKGKIVLYEVRVDE